MGALMVVLGLWRSRMLQCIFVNSGECGEKMGSVQDIMVVKMDHYGKMSHCIAQLRSK